MNLTSEQRSLPLGGGGQLLQVKVLETNQKKAKSKPKNPLDQNLILEKSYAVLLSHEIFQK